MFIVEIFIVTLIFLAGMSIVLITMKTGVSPMPSTGRARRAIMNAVEENADSGTIADLGAGWGTLVIALARKYPGRLIVGYELSFVPWLFSLMLKYVLRLNNVTFYRQNFLAADLSHIPVIVCYLFPSGMALLEEKLKKEMKQDMLIVSSTFAFPTFKPLKVLNIDDIYRSPVYIYHQRVKEEPL